MNSFQVDVHVAILYSLHVIGQIMADLREVHCLGEKPHDIVYVTRVFQATPSRSIQVIHPDQCCMRQELYGHCKARAMT